MSKSVRRLTVTQITSILGRRFQVDISPRKASCLCSALPVCLCPSPCQLPIVTRLAASCPMSPKANYWSGSSLQVSLSVSPLLPSLSFQSHSPVELSSDPHPNSSDLFPSQWFSLPPATSPLPVLLPTQLWFTDLSFRLLHLYFVLFIVSFTIKCFLEKKEYRFLVSLYTGSIH